MSERVDFNAAAAHFDENPLRVQRAWQVVEAILREVPVRPDMCALDFGCGTGLIALALQPHVCDIVAVDNAQAMLEIVQQKVQAGGLENLRPLLLDLEQEDLTESGFDLIVSSMAFHHLHEPALVLRRLAKGLNSGGFVAVADLDGGSEDFHDQDEGIKHHGFG
ncbi:MAG: methyltransferase domain-containing protein, partial [Armatimonadia bacterium]